MATGYNNVLTLARERKTRVGFAALVPSKNSMKINSVIKEWSLIITWLWNQ